MARLISLVRVTLGMGGATIDTRTMRPVNPRAGYAVGMADGTAATVRADASELVLRRAIRRVAREYGAEYVGTWHTGDTIAIDPVAIVPTKRTAIMLGRRARQEAIYGFRSARTIYVSGNR